MRRAVISVAMLLIACGCKRKAAQAEERAAVTANNPAIPPSIKNKDASGAEGVQPGVISTEITVHHVIFHEKSGLYLKAEWLRGRLYPSKPDVIPSLDDPNSFQVEIEDGRTEITLPSLSNVLSAGVLKDSKLSNVQVSAKRPQEIQISALLHALFPMPVELTGEIGTTADGRMSIHVTKLKVLKMPFKGLLGAMKISPASLMRVRNSRDIQINGDSIYVDPTSLLPAPRKLGKVREFRITKAGELEQVYGNAPVEGPVDERLPDSNWTNFVKLSGGTIRFGKLVMNDADMVLIDTSQHDWLHFDLAHYRDQLTRGDMRMTTSGGLRVFIPDITKIGGK